MKISTIINFSILLGLPVFGLCQTTALADDVIVEPHVKLEAGAALNSKNGILLPGILTGGVSATSGSDSDGIFSVGIEGALEGDSLSLVDSKFSDPHSYKLGLKGFIGGVDPVRGNPVSLAQHSFILKGDFEKNSALNINRRGSLGLGYEFKFSDLNYHDVTAQAYLEGGKLTNAQNDDKKFGMVKVDAKYQYCTDESPATGHVALGQLFRFLAYDLEPQIYNSLYSGNNQVHFEPQIPNPNAVCVNVGVNGGVGNRLAAGADASIMYRRRISSDGVTGAMVPYWFIKLGGSAVTESDANKDSVTDMTTDFTGMLSTGFLAK